MAERKLNGIWNAARILQGLLCFTDDRGNIRSLDFSGDSQMDNASASQDGFK